jgi:hypothetical protein
MGSDLSVGKAGAILFLLDLPRVTWFLLPRGGARQEVQLSRVARVSSARLRRGVRAARHAGPTDGCLAGVLPSRAIDGGGRRRRSVRHGCHRPLAVFAQTEEDATQYQDKRAERCDTKPIGSIAIDMICTEHCGLATRIGTPMP